MSDAGTEQKTFSEKVMKVINEIKTWTVLDLKEFKDAYQDVFGVTAAAPVAVMTGGGGGEAAPVAAAKDTFDVHLKDAGPNKINVIKVVRQATNLGLKEAKALVDTAPKPVKEGLPKPEAEALKKELEAAGATVELK